MPKLQPLRAVRYRASSDLSTLICPPYDVISPSERERLSARDPHNAVHLELPDTYGAAADALRAWLSDGTLARDDAPAIYPYEQRFATDSGGGVARGFFCLVRLEPYGPASGVRPHEATLGPAKEDRFRLLSAVRMNVSPVLLVYESPDAGAAGSRILDSLTAGEPVGRAVDAQGDHHSLWMAGAGSASARALLDLAGGKPLTIADGHHRYETALRYAQRPGTPEVAQFVLALLYDAHGGGLRLRPWHRLLHGIDAGRLAQRLPAFFDVQARPDPRALIGEMQGARQGTLGFWTRAGGSLLGVRRSVVAPLVAGAGSDTLRWLDVSVLSATLSEMESSSEAGAPTLTYTSDALQALSAVESGDADACFLLTPTPIEAVMTVAAEGEHMPAKSTYFQPKAATGLVFHALFE